MGALKPSLCEMAFSLAIGLGSNRLHTIHHPREALRLTSVLAEPFARASGFCLLEACLVFPPFCKIQRGQSGWGHHGGHESCCGVRVILHRPAEDWQSWLSRTGWLNHHLPRPLVICHLVFVMSTWQACVSGNSAHGKLRLSALTVGQASIRCPSPQPMLPSCLHSASPGAWPCLLFLKVLLQFFCMCLLCEDFGSEPS